MVEPVGTTDWDRIRRLYVETDIPLATICTEEGVTAYQLRRQRESEAWPPRRGLGQAGQTLRGTPERQGPAASKAGVSQARRAKARRRPPSLGERRELLYRLYEAIVTKVTQLETLTVQTVPRSTADFDKEARALATMIRNFERVMEAQADIERSGKSGGTAKSDGNAAADLAADAERWRCELAERFRQFCSTGAG